MGLGLFLMLIILILLVLAALFITGIVFIIVGGKGKKRNIGIVMVALPIFLALCTAGSILLYNARVKCIADEWRYKPFFMPRNEVTSSSGMLRELLESIDDEDEDKIYREFSANVRNDRYFDDTVEEFFDDIENLKVDLDPDDFLSDYGKSVHLPWQHSVIAGYIYSAKIDGETYYCYVRICCGPSGDKDDVGLQQFIICTEDKVDELYEIIEDGNDVPYLAVL